MAVAIAPPDQAGLLAPLLPALPAAAAATRPAIKLLPLLSPILRQRVQLLSESSSEPWLRLLCYDPAKTAQLAEIARGPSLEPHPVSGEVEIDWGYHVETRYRRLDEETLQALVSLLDLGIAFQLVYCVGDQEGGGDGWRIGEVTVADRPSPFARFGGFPSIAEAERQFRQRPDGTRHDRANGTGNLSATAVDDGDDDDDYWRRYDGTPSRTPAIKRSPAPRTQRASPAADPYRTASAEDKYFARYDQVQPALDGHDADEEVRYAQVAPPLGLGPKTAATDRPDETSAAAAGLLGHKADGVDGPEMPDMMHPRPESSASSNGCDAIARLEETAGKQEQNEFGVKQHVARSIRSLYMLSRASGIAREEFRRLVETELAVLGMTEDDD